MASLEGHEVYQTGASSSWRSPRVLLTKA